MSNLDQIASRIIKEQELIIGPIAWQEAEKVQGLHVLDERAGQVELTNGDPKEVVDRLVSQYERLFGRASHEVCRDAVKSMLTALDISQIPSSLRA
jgi:hypothetical protein